MSQKLGFPPLEPTDRLPLGPERIYARGSESIMRPPPSSRVYTGTATITKGNISKVVTHNLGFTPKVCVTPQTFLGGRDFRVTSKSSTQLTIEISMKDLTNDHSFEVIARE